MKKIKVLRIINRFNIGGPTYNATFLTRYLGDDFETLLIGGLPEAEEADSLHILEKYGVNPKLIEEMKRNPNLKSDRLAYKVIKSIIEDFKPDIVHTHAAKAGALGRKAAKAANVPIIIHTFHGHVFSGYFNPIKTSIFKIIERRLSKISTRIVAISPLQKEDLVNKYKICTDHQTEIVPLGFDLTKFHQNKEENRSITRDLFHIEEDEIAIGIIGRLVPIKNHLFLIDVMKEISKSTHKKVRLFIVGDGEEKENIQREIDNFHWPVNIKIEFTSWIKDIHIFNPGMDIICLCSLNEGTPVSLIEAQAANIPVITTDVGGVKDIILNKKTGIIVTSNDKIEYTKQLLLLIEDDNFRMELSKEGWNHVKSKFHYTRLVEDMRQLYFKLLKEKNVI